MNMKKINVAIVDDHVLFTGALSEMVNQLERYNVLFRAGNGKDFIEKIQNEQNKLPHIVLLDLNMPLMDGFETLTWIRNKKMDTKVLILSMNDDEQGIVRSLRLGANGYLLKNVSPSILEEAMDEIMRDGFYHNEIVSNALLHSMKRKANTVVDDLKRNELIFLRFACTDRTYKEIADEMNLSHKTVDGYRKNLFEKLNVKSRIGLVLFAMQHKLIE